MKLVTKLVQTKLAAVSHCANQRWNNHILIHYSLLIMATNAQQYDGRKSDSDVDCCFTSQN